jgi:hypothetical protein
MDNFTHTEYLEKITLENKNDFFCLLIKPGTIKQVSWMDPQYAYKLMELDLFQSIKTNQDNFIEVLATSMEIPKYQVKNLSLKNEIIAEEPGYVYELIYVDLENDKEYQNDSNLNEMASLINVNGDLIYSNALLLRTHLPSLSNSMILCTVTKEDLARIIHSRVHTMVVTWDGTDGDGHWVEDRVIGDMAQYADIFFDGNSYQKLELPFLMHNINIYYTTSDYGNHSICGNLIDERIDRCIWFSMKSDEFRGNLTLDEVKKIIYISQKTTNWQTPEELTKEQNDEFGRKVIYNKYKALDWMFNQFGGFQKS